MTTDQGKTQEVRCPLTTSDAKRNEANKLAANVQSSFPAGLSQPALRALAGAGYTRLAQLSRIREADLAKLHGMGPKGVRILREALQLAGKSFLP